MKKYTSLDWKWFRESILASDLLKITIFLENGKYHFFGQKNFGQPTKCNFELKMLRFHENHLKTNVKERFSQFFLLRPFLKFMGWHQS